MSVNGLSGEDIPVLCVLHDADLFSKGGKRMSGIRGNFDARASMTESFTMLSVCILIGMAIVLIGFLVYGWKKRIFIENYGIYWIASGVVIFLVAFHVFERARYQNFVILVVNDVILFAAFVIAGIIGYCQSKQKSNNSETRIKK